MATNTQWHPGIPVVRIHSPHVDWHHLQHPARAALATAATLVALGIGAAFASELAPVIEGAMEDTAAPAVHWQQPELPREWRLQPKPVRFDHMYGSKAKAPSVDHMFRRLR
jgi:hypothetical protein